MSAPFVYRRRGRDRRTALIVIAVWTALILGWLFLEMSRWIVLGLGAFTLPALWDHYANPLSGMAINAHKIAWFSGRRDAEVALEQVDHLRLDTRLDFSVRATVVLKDGRKLRIPFEATPPHLLLETALAERGIPTRRFHFQLFQ